MFGKKKTPWDNSNTVDQVVDSLRRKLVKLDLIEPGIGYSDSELQEAESRMGSRIPDEVRLFYKKTKPKRFELDNWPPVGIFRLEEEYVRWYDFVKDIPHPLEMILEPAIEREDPGLHLWQDARIFMLGGTPYFDRLLSLYDHPSYPDGTVLFSAHEDDHPLIIVAKSLAQYLQRLAYFDGIDLACYPGEEGLKHYDREMDDIYLDNLNDGLWNPYGE